MKSFIIVKEDKDLIIKFMENDDVVEELKNGMNLEYSTGDSVKEWKGLCYIYNKELVHYYKKFIDGDIEEMKII
jgi:hypothetical protein